MVAVMMNGTIKDDLPDELWVVLQSVAFNMGDTIHDFDDGLEVKPLKGAMTNEVYQITWPMKENGLTRNVIVRIYGEGVDLFFNREDEIRTFESMSKHGQGPRLLGRFDCGRVEEFIHARTLSAADLRDRSISALIAAKLRDFHGLDMPGSRKVQLWGRMRNWVNEAKKLCSKEEIKEFRLDVVEEELHLLEKELSSTSQAVGFCHNDLQYGNIMMDEETKFITIIDYEYASYNPVAYDLANHFCEMGANYHTETPHVLDYTLYPDEEERRRFATIYLSSAGNKPSDDEVEQLLKDVEKYTLPNHLFWGLWGLISSYVNDIDFDYKEYARQRFRQYWSTKPLLLGSTTAACHAEI